MPLDKTTDDALLIAINKAKTAAPKKYAALQKLPPCEIEGVYGRRVSKTKPTTKTQKPA